MKEITTRTKKQTSKIKERFINYTKDEIEELIVKDLADQGHLVDTVSFETDRKNVEDEWGMNSYTLTYFKGASAKLLTKTESKEQQSLIRVMRLLDRTGQEALAQNIGIEIKNADGSLRSLSDIIDEIGDK